MSMRVSSAVHPRVMPREEIDIPKTKERIQKLEKLIRKGLPHL